MAAPNGGVPKTEAPTAEALATEPANREPSKRALEKAQKKAAKALKKAEYAMRPKETLKESKTKSIFEESWLKKTYEDKPVPPGAVQTRFPPEPNGFLHIGHTRAIAINFGFAKHYGGRCFLRYDDSNPEKEKEIYFTAIQDVIRWLGFELATITYTSDHFEKLYELAEILISKDKAYVCHCSRGKPGREVSYIRH